MSITITKVRGEEETMKTKVFRVPVYTPYQRKTHAVKAIGIPSITDEVTPVDVSSIAKQLSLESEVIRRGRGPVVLLIGIDHAQLHIGEIVQFGQLVARKILLDGLSSEAAPPKWTV